MHINPKLMQFLNCLTGSHWHQPGQIDKDTFNQVGDMSVLIHSISKCFVFVNYYCTCEFTRMLAAIIWSDPSAKEPCSSLTIGFQRIKAKKQFIRLIFIHSFIHFLFSIIIKQFNTKIINIKKIKKRKKQHNITR